MVGISEMWAGRRKKFCFGGVLVVGGEPPATGSREAAEIDDGREIDVDAILESRDRGVRWDLGHRENFVGGHICEERRNEF